MTFSFSIKKWYGLSSGLSSQIDWLQWASGDEHDWTLPLPKFKKLPPMQARRMSVPSRLAVEVGLVLIEDEQVDFAIFVSRHGELERSTKILTTLNQSNDISPTDFALSVHNSASGLLSIIAKQTIPITSISAKHDGFQQALLEAQSLFKQGYKRILIIDFDGVIPNLYHEQCSSVTFTYGVGFVLTNDSSDLACKSIVKDNHLIYKPNYPQSLAFLHAYLSKQQQFRIEGNFQDWQWTRNYL